MSRKSIFAIALFTVTAAAQTLPQGVQKKASMGGITEYDYPNGLKVLLYPVASTPQITVNMVYEVGSRHEGYGETGMAHLLEHMNFIETTNGRQVKNELVDHGANWNGTTNPDSTDFYETFNASDENLKWALSLETDRMIHIKFTKKILDTEMTVVRNEFERGENNPGSILSERVEATAYLWHNYGKSTIGSKEDIERVPVDRLEAFYHKYYRPDNCVAVITGKIDETKTLQFVADSLGKIPEPKTPVEQTYTVEPPQDGERYVELKRVGQNPELIVAYHSVAAGHPDSAVLQVMAALMSGGGGGRGGRGGGGGRGGADPENEGRLRKFLVDTKLAESASMGARMEHDPGLVTFRATLTKDQSLDAAKKAMYEAIEDFIAHPPTPEQVERAKTNLVRGLENQLTNPASLATGGLHQAIAEGDWRLMFLQNSRLKDVSVADLERVAKLYFKPSNRTVGYYIPDAAPDRTVVPATPDLEAILKDYKNNITVVHAEAFDPSPANVEKLLVHDKLSNGMKLVTLKKSTDRDRVTATIELRFGDDATLKGQRIAGQFATSLLNGDTKSHTRQQIQDELRKLDAQVNVGGGGGFGGRGGGRGGRGGGGGGGVTSGVNANISASPANFVAAMKLAVEMLKEPVYKDEDFQRSLEQRERGLQLPQTEPTQLAAEALQRNLTPNTPGDLLYTGTREEQLAELKTANLDAVRKFHDQFFGANYGVMAVVGPIDAAVVKQTADELLGHWNTPMAYKPVFAHYKPGAAPINLKIETPDKANAQFEAGLRFQMSESDPDYPAMLLAGYLFGGPITSRVSDRIRNREGLSYGANARVAIPTEGDAASLTGTVSLNPQNGPKVEASFVDELRKTARDGFTAAEIQTGKQAYLDSRRGGRGGDQQLLTTIANNELRGRTMLYEQQLDDKIKALTVDQVNAAFRKHIDPTKLSIVKAGDWKAAGVYQ
ncbi:MAG TPA: pitrilysin family protein [Verrucomicrobiae bacterium]|nr:pitrilysin family protein [Verrucomicrobiae bacterium]